MLLLTNPGMQLLDMPASWLVMILQHVPLQQRLGVCTRVCHAFHTAAVAATNSISITRMSSQEQCDNVSEWLQLHGGGITRLDIQEGHELSLACLPCPALRDLNLQGLSVQQGFLYHSRVGFPLFPQKRRNIILHCIFQRRFCNLHKLQT